jgi:hypothetical protein
MGAGPHHFAHRFRIARLVSPQFSNGFFFSRRIIVNWRWDFVPGTLYLLPGRHQELWFWSLKLGNHSSVQWYTVLLRPEIWGSKLLRKKYDCGGMNTWKKWTVDENSTVLKQPGRYRRHRDVCLRSVFSHYEGVYVYESWCSDSRCGSAPALLPLLILGICAHSMYTSRRTCSHLPQRRTCPPRQMSFGGRWAVYKEKVCQFLTANVGTEGMSENFLFWDVFKELLVTQSVLHWFEWNLGRFGRLIHTQLVM